MWSSTMGEENREDYAHPVGKKKPNAWGLYDMQANIEEWCSDWSDKYTEANQIDPQGPSSPPAVKFGRPIRATRGSGWWLDTFYCSSARRGGAWPNDSGDYVGFRIVVEPE